MTLADKIAIRHIPLKRLFDLAKDLLEPGEEHLNPEYTRALVNLLGDAAGMATDEHDQVAAALGADYVKLMEAADSDYERRRAAFRGGD